MMKSQKITKINKWERLCSFPHHNKYFIEHISQADGRAPVRCEESPSFIEQSATEINRLLL